MYKPARAFPYLQSLYFLNFLNDLYLQSAPTGGYDDPLGNPNGFKGWQVNLPLTTNTERELGPIAPRESETKIDSIPSFLWTESPTVYPASQYCLQLALFLFEGAHASLKVAKSLLKSLAP